LKNKQLIGLHTLSFETKGIKTEEAKDLAWKLLLNEAVNICNCLCRKTKSS
jgi:hypothetical protein